MTSLAQSAINLSVAVAYIKSQNDCCAGSEYLLQDSMFFRLAHNISRCRPMVTKGLNRAYFSVLKGNYDRELNVQNVQQAGGSRMLNVTWNNDTVGRFPFVFLRDNCQCSECFHESSVQRTYDTFNKLDMHIQPQRVEVLQNGEQISITWPDKHVSLFSSQWLHSRQATEQANTTKERSSLQREGVRVWNANKLQGKIPSYSFQDVIKDDFTLYEWLHSLHSVGIALLKNTPRQPGECNQLCARVGYTKTTNFGYVNYFSVNK